MPVHIRLLALVCAALLSACAAPAPEPSLPPLEERSRAWDAWRTAKDSLFRSPESPLLSEDRPGFERLAYFPYDSALVFALALNPTLQRDTLRLATSTGAPRDYIRFGYLSFPLGDRRHRLTVFQPTDGDTDLFLPFADATNGRGTYRAGRYLDFEPSADGRYVLDLNYAYHPYCVYNPAYSCPLPPAENRIEALVRAGERLAD